MKICHGASGTASVESRGTFANNPAHLEPGAVLVPCSEGVAQPRHRVLLAVHQDNLGCLQRVNKVSRLGKVRVCCHGACARSKQVRAVVVSPLL